MIKQVLLNILINAKDEIVKTPSTNKNIFLNLVEKSDKVVIEIDNYSGEIDSKIIKNIFKKRFTTKGEEGSGLGLHLCVEIIKSLCGGDIFVEKLKNGIRFKIELPSSKEIKS